MLRLRRNQLQCSVEKILSLGKLSLVGEVLCQAHAVATEILDFILFRLVLAFYCETAVQDSFFYFSDLLVYLSQVKVGLS
jgi:hypothetical protein